MVMFSIQTVYCIPVSLTSLPEPSGHVSVFRRFTVSLAFQSCMVMFQYSVGLLYLCITSLPELHGHVSVFRWFTVSLYHYMATNPSPSSHIPMGQNFLFFVFWEQNLEIGQCYTLRHSLNFWTLLSVFNEYVTRQLRMCWCGEKGTFSNFNTAFRINLCFLTK